MCGIAGLIHRGKTGDVGREMTAMLLSLKHRGPDSTGYALYGKPHGKELVIRFKVAEQDEMSKGFAIQTQVKERRAEVARRLGELGAHIIEEEEATPYAFRLRISYEGDQRRGLCRSACAIRSCRLMPRPSMHSATASLSTATVGGSLTTSRTSRAPRSSPSATGSS